MQIVLKFNLPGDKDDETLARRGKEFWKCLWDLDVDVHGWIKNGHQFKTADEVLKNIQDRLIGMDLACVE